MLGGCEIGQRPIDPHISAFLQLGIDVFEYDNTIECRCDVVKSGEIFFATTICWSDREYYTCFNFL
uniref:hypothetical protein n=1 Tax=Caldicellulosiruptor naganoensis TaxID=29324 RepID=UPI002FDD4C26